MNIASIFQLPTRPRLFHLLFAFTNPVLLLSYLIYPNDLK